LKTSKLWVFVACSLLLVVLACGKKEEPAATDTAAGSGAAPSASATAFDPATGTATISGKVTFEGTAPKGAQIRMNADPVCTKLHPEPVYAEEVLVTDGKLQNVFVWVKEGLEKYTFTPPAEPGTLNQEGCHYMPHVSGLMVNQKLKIVNSDPTLHNIHCWAEQNPQFNVGQPIKGMETEKSFAVPEVMIHFKCDVHKWMSSYIGIVPHPYFGVTGQDGTYTLKNLPPGEYTIEAWHEKFGTKSQKITVGDKETKEADFSFAATS
jgi:hypothetical protein